MGGQSSGASTAAAPIIGREDVLDEVERLLEQSKAGRSHGLLVAGARGSGKSVVLEAAVDRGRCQRFRVLSAHALPEELPSPFSLIRGLLGSAPAHEGGRARPAPGSGLLPIFLAPFQAGSYRPSMPSRAARTSDSEDFERTLATLGTGIAEDGQAGREELFGAVEEYFHMLGRDQPLFLAIDDLHFSDLSSLEFLRRLVPGRLETPVLVIATIGVGREVPFRNRSAIDALSQSPSFRSTTLRALTLPETTQFVRWLYRGRDPNPQDVLRWQSQTEGNPLFLEQLVRIATGYASRAANQGPLTSGRDVNEIFLALYGGLDEENQNLLTHASVLGKEFHASDIPATEGTERENLTERLRALVQEGFLRSKGADLYEFVTESLRASIYSNATETRRRILHRKAGLALEAGGRADDDELARQFYLGRDDDRSVKYNLRAAEAANRTFAFENALTHVSRALESERRRAERDPRIELRLLTEEGRLLVEMGNLRQAEGVLNDAVMMARSLPGQEIELGHTLLILAECRSRRGEYPNAIQLATEAGKLLETGGTPRDQMEVHRVLGRCYVREGDLGRSEASHRKELEIAEQFGTPYEQGRAMFNLASPMIVRGMSRFDEASELYARAAERFGRGEDFGAKASVLNNRALLEWTSAGRLDDALRDLTLALAAAERSRSRTRIGYILNNLAQLNVELGQTGPARSALERAIRTVAPIGDEYMEQQLAMSRGMVAQKEGAFEEAAAAYQEALTRARDLHQAPETAEVMMRLAELAHDRGDDPTARRWLAESRANRLLDYRPDFGPRVSRLETSIAGSEPPSDS